MLTARRHPKRLEMADLLVHRCDPGLVVAHILLQCVAKFGEIRERRGVVVGASADAVGILGPGDQSMYRGGAGLAAALPASGESYAGVAPDAARDALWWSQSESFELGLDDVEEVSEQFIGGGVLVALEVDHLHGDHEAVL